MTAQRELMFGIEKVSLTLRRKPELCGGSRAAGNEGLSVEFLSAGRGRALQLGREGETFSTFP